MFKFTILSSLLMVSIFSAETKVDCDISGIWQHSAKPATLFIDLSKGEVSVQSHDNNVNAVGLVVVKNLALDSTSSFWRGKMYSAAEDLFVDVKVTLASCNQLSVSFEGEEVLGLLR